MTAVLYLSAVASPEQFQVVEDAKIPGVRSITYGMPHSGQKFGFLIQKGLAGRPNTFVTALSSRAVNPAFHRGRYWHRVKVAIQPNWVIDHLGFPNIKVLRQLSLAAQITARVLEWRWRTRKLSDRVFISDGAYVTALPGALLGLAGSNVTKIAVFADIYSYMGHVRDANNVDSPLFRLLRVVTARTYRQLDGFVLLTEQMNQVVNPEGKPHMVMEGVADGDVAGQRVGEGTKSPNPTILYAGALRREYGLANLVEGFSALQNMKARLIIYGDGDYADELRHAAAADPRIDYRGNVPVSQVIKAEQSAWLLINPRPDDQEFTRYSFPSKNLEYLTSGTAVLTTRLAGMPDEYLDYVLTIDQPGADGITAALEEALDRGIDELTALGARGREFVRTAKNHDRQAKRILGFAQGLRR